MQATEPTVDCVRPEGVTEDLPNSKSKRVLLIVSRERPGKVGMHAELRRDPTPHGVVCSKSARQH